MSMLKAVLLYDEKNSAFFSAMSSAKEAGFSVTAIKFSKASAEDLDGAAVAINAMGERYPEDKAGLVASYVFGGGVFINLGGAPLGVPVADGADDRETKKGVCALDLGDSFTKIPLSGKYRLEVLSENLGEGSPIVESAPKSEICGGFEAAYSGLYSLSHDAPEGRLKHADLTPIVGLYDDGRLLAAPVVKIKYRSGGSVILFEYDLSGGDPLASPLLRGVFVGLMKLSALGDAVFTLSTKYPRYDPAETPTAVIKDIFTADRRGLSFELTLLDSSGKKVFAESVRAVGRSRTVILPNLEKGFYRLCARAMRRNSTVCYRENGFIVATPDDILARVSGYERMTVDPSVSTDFFTRGGKPIPLHGTTYFVTDVWQNCFVDFNAALCINDLRQLRRDGFNILRSGNWVNQLDFYGPDGRITEYCRRALQVYFLLAAEQDFTVQFTLGHIALNNWDTSLCAVHNPKNLRKVKNLVSSFAELFGGYPNVMLDILNEPSYSRKGMWQRVIPSGDEFEKRAWNRWLKEKYVTVARLRSAWGENSAEIKSFGDIPVPSRQDFGGDFCRSERLRKYTAAADFWQFAQESYDNWLGVIRETVKKISPETVIIMGRDETLRVPQEQNGAAKGLLDAVNWHQWNRDGQLYQEYMLNRIRGHICCAQELGVYRYISPRGGRRLGDERVSAKLERKLMFGFGNWIQWQSFSDPDRDELCENMLGVYRSDRSETPAVEMMRKLISAENSAMKFIGRRDDAFPIITLYPTCSHYSIYNQLALGGLRRHIDILSRGLRLQSDLVPENLFRDDFAEIIGRPKLIIIPAAMRLSEECLETALGYVKSGSTLLISGNIDEDEHFRTVGRISRLLGSEHRCRPIMTYEKAEICGREFTLDFKEATDYAEVENALTAAVSGEKIRPEISPLGKGKIIYFPLPTELARSDAAAKALYKFAADEAGVHNCVYSAENLGEEFFIHAIKYGGCVEYTLINEGADGTAEFTDLSSGRKISLFLPSSRSAKLWLGSGGLLEKYLPEDSELKIS